MVREWVPSVPYLHITVEKTSPGVCSTGGTNGTGFSEKFSVKVVYGWVREWVPSVPYLHITVEETSPGVCSTGGTHKREEEDRKDGREAVVIRLAGQGDLLSGFSRGWLSGLASRSLFSHLIAHYSFA